MITFITGDRSDASVYGPLVSIEMVRALANGNGISTGDSEHGIDAMVRFIAERADVAISLVTGFEKNFDARNEAALAVADEVVVIHSAPETSSAIKSLLQNDDTRLVTHMDLMV